MFCKNLYAGNLYLFCEHRMVVTDSNDITEKYFLSSVFAHNEPYSKYCNNVNLRKIEKNFKRHLEFIDYDVSIEEGFTACNCYSHRLDAKKAHKNTMKALRRIKGAKLRNVSDFLDK